MEPKNPLQILFDAELMSEFGMTKSFIACHAKQMGSRGRPRKFLRVNVERFVSVYFNDQLMEALAKKAEEVRAEELFRSLKQPFFSGAAVAIGGGKMGKILGRGGRVQKDDERKTNGASGKRYP